MLRFHPISAFAFFSATILLLLVISRSDAQLGAYRRNYVLERKETWGEGHEYVVREEQPFFRVYHEPHQKVFRDSPNAGKADAKQTEQTGQTQSQQVVDPMQSQLMEEQGSDQRLREAAQFWRERNQGQKKRQQSERAKRALVDKETDWGNGGDAKNADDKWWKHVAQELGQEQWMLTHMPQQQQQQPRTEHGLAPVQTQVLERNQSRSSAKFGHHNLPSGEQKDTATWPWQIWPFMPCLTLECVCPLFRGNVSGHTCILPNGKPLKRALRKEFRTYTKEELALFLEVMGRFKSTGLYSRLGMIHRRSGVHSGPSFFPWHREFLKRLEIVFRALHPENSVGAFEQKTNIKYLMLPLKEPILGLPYWDSSLDGDLPAPEDSVMFSEFLLGEPDDAGYVVNGLFANWTTMDGRRSYQRMFGDQPDGEFFSEARIDYVLSQTQVDRVLAFSLPLHTCLNYRMDDRFLEYSHDYVHYFISGDMQERFSSSNDPIFFMHHGFIDSVWEKWRQTKQTRLQRERDYPRDDGECMPEWHFSYAYMPLLQPLRNMDALSNNYTDHMYEYAPRPSCPSGESAECGNTEFLWCDTKTHIGHPVCAAKVKPGGSCARFEWSAEICYGGGRCVEGRCTKRTDGPRQQLGDLHASRHASFMRK